MPELPDLTVYQEALASRLMGRRLERIRFASPFLLRTAEPPIGAMYGRRASAIERLGKRLVIALEGNFFIAIHLMIAGRLRWTDAIDAPIPGRIGLAAFDWETGTLVVTEAGSKRRAAMHVFANREALASLDDGGLDPLTASLETFAAALTRENHTLKRSLTDPRILSGIGNAYSDEILHAARLSPTALSQKIAPEAMARLHEATRQTLRRWIDRLTTSAAGDFPEKVTAFHPEMSVHGRYGQPCPVCGSKVQRIVLAETESNYCATCQTGGKLLADRALSRLLGKDWPKTLAEMEARRGRS